LYRLLNDLKKNGLLGRETILRKTMLDDCKGDKFLEVLVVFSTAVVRKVAVPRIARTGSQQPVAFGLATETTLGPVGTGSLIPLTVAHQASLSSLLRQKIQVKARCQQFSNLLEQKSDQLTQRTMLCNDAAKPALNDEDLTNVEKHIKENWPGNSKWPRALLYGDDSNPGDQPLRRPFPQVWGVIISGGTLQANAESTGLVQDLERRITEQQSRLQKWRSFHQDMSQNAFVDGLSNSHGHSARSKTGFEFQKHVGLQLKQNQTKSEFSGRRHIANAKLSAIVTDLHQELEEASKPMVRLIDPVKQVLPMEAPIQRARPASVSFANHVGGQMGYSHNRGLSGTVGLTRSSTAVPLSRVFSPAKSFRLNSRSTSNSSTEATNSSVTTHASIPDLAEPTPPPTPKVVLPEDHHEYQDSYSTMSGSIGSDNDVSSINSGDDLAEDIITSVMTAQSPTPGSRMSLAERTRQSMSQANSNSNSQSNHHLQPYATKPSGQEAHPATAGIAYGIVAERRTSLLERTQQSMSNLNLDPHSRSRKSLSLRKSRNSIAFPVNQFETPGRPRPEPMRNATPTEKLFSEEADYSSVFKSRPRVAYSPGPSPNGEDLPSPGGIIYEEMEDDSMMEDVDGDSWIRSSPLRGRG